MSGSQIQGVSSGSFTMVITLNVVGQYGIRVNNPGGAQSNTFNLNVQATNPSISSISPTTPTRNDNDQNVQVSGSNFVNGLTVTVFIPGGGTATLSGSQIHGVSSGSFTMAITLNVVGQYGIRVSNPGGAQSNTFNFNVQSSTLPPPTVNSISPNTPQSSGTDQNVSVIGNDFQQNLTVSVTFPGGGGATLSGTQIQNVTSTSFVMRITLGSPGAWSIRVNNPDGGQSAQFNFSVIAPPNLPTVTSINPTAPVSKASDQDIVVFGTNFQHNLRVEATFPSGGGTVLSGDQIRNLTNGSFILRITLNEAGNWKIKVQNPDGSESTVFSFAVINSVNGLPRISSIDPSSPIAKAGDRDVTVNGANFTQGLSVKVVFPNGQDGLLQGSGQIFDLTPTSFTMRITLNGEGEWGIRAVNLDGGQSDVFKFNVAASSPPPTALPTSVLSPVIGRIRVTSSNEGCVQSNRDKWEFAQHMDGYHRAGGGIRGSNDKFAWDANFYAAANCNEDEGEPVYATADGDVVSFAGVLPSNTTGVVLIAHPNKEAPVWWSGYLHLKNVKVSLNQRVSSTTHIGDVGRTGVTTNDHLHFVLYRGENRQGGLQSFNAGINERTPSSSAGQIPVINTIDPISPVIGGRDQDITVIGSNFQQDLTLYIGFPQGGGKTLSGEQIRSVTPNSFVMRATLNNTGTWSIRVNNPDSTQSTPFTFDVQAPQAEVTPLIFIPGIAGSRLDKRGGTNLWVGQSLDPSSRRELTLDPQSSDFQADGVIQATDALRTDFLIFGQLARHEIITYQGLIDMLKDPSQGGYREYQVSFNPQRQTTSGCDVDRQRSNNPTLFVFAYDWRKSSETNATALKDYVGCVQRFYPGTKVNILAHSMGGILARRYIINDAQSHSVDKLITVGTPWLGAPRAINVLETGEFLDGKVQQWLTNSLFKSLSEFFPGMHELMPSRWYFHISDRPTYMTEKNPNSYNEFIEQLNRRYSRSRPGETGRAFHDTNGQDNWQNDQSGVKYFHFFGRQSRDSTVGQVIAKTRINCHAGTTRFCTTELDFDVKMTRGDGTVPEVSGARSGQGLNLNASGSTVLPFVSTNDDQVSHQGLTDNPDLQGAILSALRSPSSANAARPSEQNKPQAATESAPSHYLKISGVSIVRVTDAFGNAVSPLSDSIENGLPSVSSHVLRENSLLLVFPTDQNHSISFKSEAKPITVEITTGTAETNSQAIRYRDLNLPVNVEVRLQITPEGIGQLVSDVDRDGIFEAVLSPTATASGLAAQDVDGPSVSIVESIQGADYIITITAADNASGVRSIMYSVDGLTYQPYSTPFTLNQSQASIIYAFADDNVANRSGLVEHSLTAISNVQFGVSGYTINESSNIATVTLTRSGDATNSASVGFVTSDGAGLQNCDLANGLASSRCDYISALGTVSFAPGETSKTISILIVDDVYAEGSETFTISLNNPSGAALGTQSVATVTITDNDAAIGTNPIDAAAFFVDEHYRDFLGRLADPAGRAFWTNQITSCGSDAQCIEVRRIDVSASFFLSIEFQDTGYLVERIYKTAYGEADGTSTFGGAHTLKVPIVRLNEFLADSQQIGQGVVVLQQGWEQVLEKQQECLRGGVCSASAICFGVSDFNDSGGICGQTFSECRGYAFSGWSERSNC